MYLVPGGVPGPGGCLLPGGVPGLGVSAPCPGGVSGTPPCEQNDKQVQKYYLAPNFVCGQ